MVRMPTKVLCELPAKRLRLTVARYSGLLTMTVYECEVERTATPGVVFETIVLFRTFTVRIACIECKRATEKAVLAFYNANLPAAEQVAREWLAAQKVEA